MVKPLSPLHHVNLDEALSEFWHDLLHQHLERQLVDEVEVGGHGLGLGDHDADGHGIKGVGEVS